MKLTLGFSPCPNDTFIFDALVNKKIDTEDLDFEVILEDVETLNTWAFEEKLDVTKLSFPAFFQNSDKYVLLHSGSALGKGVGPLLITNKKEEIKNENVKDYLIALPGKNTTANLLFSFAYPKAKNKIFIRFDTIEDFVIAESSKIPPSGGGGALGVIIHENRFTYQQKGLFKVIDLGEFWEEKMNTPLPLGGITVKRTVDRLKCLQIEKLIKRSLEFALANYPALPDYVKLHAQEMNEEVMRQHIALYVNHYSADIGQEGKKAIEVLYGLFQAQHSTTGKSHSSSLILLS